MIDSGGGGIVTPMAMTTLTVVFITMRKVAKHDFPRVRKKKFNYSKFEKYSPLHGCLWVYPQA